ncbi:hypothetical protein XELAEV_18004329mg [Xenopus laevis]|uniref:G-protein coupled receptors family 3 profile domain-containing protein n=1 Tax=Xenopus laevis TaxID=8355 RepID=A0A974BRL4_XENLA|nr:hypothetical protein XELAEV_18004329mg [Xenopus laevis]
MEINKNPAQLPNLTLGYHIYDSCGDPRKAVRSIFQISSSSKEPVPNYSCVVKRKKRNIVGFIGDVASKTTIPITQILSLYGYSQISYGATDPLLSDRKLFPYFFRTVQSNSHEYFAISKLLRHFGWTWVGIITSEDDSGEKEQQLLTKYLSSEGICVEFTVKITQISYKYFIHMNQYHEIFTKSSANIIALCGTVNMNTAQVLHILKDSFAKKTLILTSMWINDGHVVSYAFNALQGSLGFSIIYTPFLMEYQKIISFVSSIQPVKYREDKLLQEIWRRYVCSSSLDNRNSKLPRCLGNERLTKYFEAENTHLSLNLYLAVLLMSRGLQIYHSVQNIKKIQTLYPYRYKLHHYIRESHLQDAQKQNVSFDENGEFDAVYRLMNFHLHLKSVFMRHIGNYEAWDQKLSISREEIVWKNGKFPQSQCSVKCIPGFRKAPKTGYSSCCYDCVQCSEGEISNITDSENCIHCRDMEWPNENKNQCVPKSLEYLLNTDVISVFFSSNVVCFFLITLLISVIYITYRDTPIVRANNRSLSFLLLVSIKLSFLSVFLFLGRPVDITCMLRNITFGITFSIAVSSLLAKTIMVCVAFKATKPGSSWRKWVGVKLPNSVVLFCSSIQIIICMIWLAISPPFQELDLHTYPGTIIIQCNEGSAIGFYSVIGYMGLLAAVSFVLAFLARTLPDSFNEAKYITFSMLLFCSVWITMIPAYLSTKGKNTVCVEIFAILTSSAGLLASIFLPKCYIILLRPDINTKSQLLKNEAL